MKAAWTRRANRKRYIYNRGAFLLLLSIRRRHWDKAFAEGEMGPPRKASHDMPQSIWLKIWRLGVIKQLPKKKKKKEKKFSARKSQCMDIVSWRHVHTDFIHKNRCSRYPRPTHLVVNCQIMEPSLSVVGVRTPPPPLEGLDVGGTYQKGWLLLYCVRYAALFYRRSDTPRICRQAEVSDKRSTAR